MGVLEDFAKRVGLPPPKIVAGPPAKEPPPEPVPPAPAPPPVVGPPSVVTRFARLTGLPPPPKPPPPEPVAPALPPEPVPPVAPTPTPAPVGPPSMVRGGRVTGVTQIGGPPRDEEAGRLGLVSGGVSERGQIIIPQREPSPTFFATQASDREILRGEGPPPLTPERKISRAELEAGERITEERETFEEREQPRAQDVTQQKYNELIGRRAVELGMVFDAGQGVWVGSQSQIDSFNEFEPEARQQSIEFGTEFYQRQWEEFGLEDRAENILREEFGEEGFILVEKPDGTFSVVTKEKFVKQKRVEIEKERIRERITGTPEERVTEFARFVSLSVLKPVSFLSSVAGEIVLGGEDKSEKILDIFAGQTEALKGKGIGEVALSSYTDPGGLGFIGTAAALFVGGTGLLGGLTGTGGKVLQTGIPLVVGGAFATAAGVDIGITAAKEKPFDPSKGLEQIPQALFTGEAGKKVIQFGAAFSLFAGFGFAATRGPTGLPKLGKIQEFDISTGFAKQKFGLIVGEPPVGFRLPFTQVKQFQFLPSEKGIIPFRQQPTPFAETISIPPTTFIPSARQTGFERNIISLEKEVFKTTIIEKSIGFGKTTFIDIVGQPAVQTITPTRKLTIETIQKDITIPRIEELGKPTKDFVPSSFEKQISEVLPADFFVKGIEPISIETFGPKAKPKGPLRLKVKQDSLAKRKPIDITTVDTELPKSITKEFRSLATLTQARSILPTRTRLRPSDVKPLIDTFPSREISVKVDPLFFKKIITEQGTALEFKIKDADIVTKVFEGKSIIPETIVKTGKVSLRGLGTIFKPEIPGEFIFSTREGRFFGGKELRRFAGKEELKPIFIGEREAVEVFAGKIGGEPLAAFGKIRIPTELTDPRELGITLKNIDQSLFTFSNKVKTTLSQIGTLKGLGKTFPEKGFKIISPLKAFKIEVTPFITSGDLVIGGRKIPVKSFGNIIDATEGHIKGTVTGSEKALMSQFFQAKLVPTATIQAAAVSQVGALKVTSIITKPITTPIQKTKIGVVSKSQEQLITNVMKSSQLQISKQSTKQLASTKTEEKSLSRQISKEETKQTEKLLPKTETRIVTKQITETMTKQVSKSLSKQIEKTMTEQITKASTKQISKQSSKLETKLATKLIEKQTIKAVITGLFVEPIAVSPVTGVPTEGIGEPFETILAPPIVPTLGLEQQLMKGIGLAPQAYDVFVYKTQFRDGKRIRGKEEVKLNKRPLRRSDALALGSDLVDNTAKRTIVIREAEGKPTKLRKKVRSWSSQLFEYNQKDENVFVETNAHAIDSAGELQEITMKGLQARKTGGKRSTNIGLKGIGGFERKMRRMII